ncbi:MAG TPA: hypothetical protein VG367_10510 [Mucilaginibacter sp.]|jgi:hypothetical protein|nr:hypothetical protein [Mucilaginibacter sp.]
MKTIFKSLAAALLAAALFTPAKTRAQTTPANNWRLGLGIDAGVPTGSATIGANFILGGNARLQYGISNNFALTLTAGADHFFTKMIPGTNTRYQGYGVIPEKAGIKWFFVPGIYFGGELGIAEEASSTKFGPVRFDWTPGLGWASSHWDISGRYENFSGNGANYGMFALRLAYGFAL